MSPAWANQILVDFDPNQRKNSHRQKDLTMKALTLLLLLIPLLSCTSQTLTSESLSQAEIEAIQERVRQAHPELSSSKQHEVAELVIRAMDNMVFIEGGSFMMGDSSEPCEPGSKRVCWKDYDTDNNHTHKVTLSGYSISRFETTMRDFDLYREVMGKEPYAQDLRAREDRQYLFQPNLPAWTKTWAEAQAYCQWIGELSGTDGNLPTEAQWEYAARERGQDILHATSNGEIDPGENYPSSEERDKTIPVGSYPPNGIGLYDMNYNVSEWVYDWYSEDYYAKSETKDPKGPDNGTLKVLRGGMSASSFGANTTIHRESRKPKRQHYSRLLGFRCGSW
jgi:formylglycine-generating enzyme required for sulfatase activity